MYQWTNWKDEVDQYEHRFKETTNDDGTVTHEKVRGIVQQMGTNQDAAHFNNMESGIMDANLAVSLLAAALAQQRIVLEIGQITLTNNQAYPFNDSKKTVSLKKVSDTTGYTVVCEVLSSAGPVEDVSVSDKLVNGFKVQFNGSAKSAVIKYTVIGGYLA